MGAAIKYDCPFLTASCAYAEDAMVPVFELRRRWARANASRLAGAGARLHWEISQQRKSTDMLGQGMPCRTMNQVMYDNRRVKPRLQGKAYMHP